MESGTVISTEDLPEGQLLYNNPMQMLQPTQATQSGQVEGLAPIVTTEELPEGSLKYNSPLDLAVPEVKKAVAQIATDPEIKKENTTFLGYMQDKWQDLSSDIEKDYQESVSRASKAIENVAEDNITGLEGGLSIAGSTFNLFSDIVGETVVTGLGITGDGISYILPDSIEDPIKEGFKSTVSEVMNSEWGQAGLNALYEGVEAWDEYAEANPRAAENIRSVVDIGLVLAPVKKGEVGSPSKIVQAGKTLEKSEGIKQARNKAVVITDSFSNTRNSDYLGRTRSAVPKLTTQERSAIEAVSEIKGYKTGLVGDRTANKNFKLVDKELAKEKSRINKILSTTDAKVSYNSLMDSITKNMDEAIKGSLDEKRVSSAINEVMLATEKAIAKHGTSVKGIRKARTEIDNFVKARLPKDQWNPNHPMVVAANQVRKDMNDAVAAVVPEFKQSMRKQSGLIHASKGLSEKITAEHRNAITSFVVNATRSVGLTRDVGFVLVGLLGSSYAAAAAPILLAGTAGYASVRLGQGLYKAGINPSNAKKMAGKVIQITGKAIDNASGNPSMIKQLRADRAAMLQLIRDGVEIWENKKGATEVDVVSDILDDAATESDFYAEQARIKQEAEAKLPADFKPLQVEVTQGQQ